MEAAIPSDRACLTSRIFEERPAYQTLNVILGLVPSMTAERVDNSATKKAAKGPPFLKSL